MKTNTRIVGSVELSEAELIEAIKLFAKKRKEIVIQAVDSWLGVKGLSTKRIQYGDDMGSVVAIVDQPVGTDVVTVRETKQVVKRKGKKGYVKKNVGFFKNAQNIFDDFRRRGLKELNFATFMHEIRFHHPEIEEEKVKLYLYDKDYMRGITWDSKNKKIIL